MEEAKNVRLENAKDEMIEVDIKKYRKGTSIRNQSLSSQRNSKKRVIDINKDDINKGPKTSRSSTQKKKTINSKSKSKNKKLNFNKIEEQIGLYLKNSRLTGKQVDKTKEKIEELYRTELMNQFKTIDKYVSKKKELEKEILEIQKILDKSKNKLFDLNGGMSSYLQEDKFSSTNSFSKYFFQRGDVAREIVENKDIVSKQEKKITIKRKEHEKISFLIKELRFKKDNDLKLLIKYYCKLMSVGEDIRDEGLSWILYKLLELGYDISMCQYPVHITKKNFEYLKNLAELKIDKEKIKITYNALQNKYKDKFKIKKSKPNLEFLNKNKGASSTYDKFLVKYFNDKNAEIHYKKDGVEHKVLDYLNCDEKIENKEEKMEDLNLGVDTHLLINEINSLKQNLDKYEKNIKDYIKEGIQDFKNENQELRISDFNKYCFIYHCLFGTTLICT